MSNVYHIIVPIMLILVDLLFEDLTIGSSKKQKVKIFLFVIILALYAGLRSTTTMTDDYVTPYSWLRDASIEDLFFAYRGREPIYRLAVKTIALGFENVQWYFFIHALFVSGAFGIMVYRHKADPLICFMFFLTLRDFSFANCAMRQGASMAVIYAFADKFLKEKRPILFFVSVIAASLLHTSGIVFVIAYPIFHYVKKPKRFFFVVLIASMLFYSSPMRMVSFIERLKIINQYEGYIARGYETSLSTTLFLQVFFLVASLIVQHLTETHFDSNESRVLSGYENLVTLCCMFAFVGTRAGAMVRMQYLTSQYVPLMFNRTMENMGRRNYRILYVFVIMLLALQYGIFGPGQMGWNYHFFWTD